MGPAAQGLAVALIVGACALYALWALLPSAARRRLATAAPRLPLPARLAAALRAEARGACGGACDGCTATRAPDAGATRPLKFHPRPRR